MGPSGITCTGEVERQMRIGYGVSKLEMTWSTHYLVAHALKITGRRLQTP